MNEQPPWDFMMLKCDVYDGHEIMLKFIWIVLKMKSNTDKPFHPVICQHPQAKCGFTQLNCFYGRGMIYCINLTCHKINVSKI